jgi:hypothetical protein
LPGAHGRAVDAVDNFCGVASDLDILDDMIRMNKTRRHLRALLDDEVGDVPGWVLITLMTAGLVVLIWAVAGPALTNLFEQAIARVSGL